MICLFNQTGRIIGKARGRGRDPKLLHPHNFSKDNIVTKRREARGGGGGGGATATSHLIETYLCFVVFQKGVVFRLKYLNDVEDFVLENL